jgi:hypothetical protein
VQIVEGQLAQYGVDGFHFLLPGSRSARPVWHVPKVSAGLVVLTLRGDNPVLIESRDW